MAPTNTEVLISQLADQIAAKFHMQNLVFDVTLLNGAIANTTLCNRKSEHQDGAETNSIFISACR